MRLSQTTIWYTPPRQTGITTSGSIYPTPFGLEPKDFFSASTGAVYRDVRKFNLKQEQDFLFNLAIHLIIRDGFNQYYVHNTFCEFIAYRNGLSSDMPMPNHLAMQFKKEIEKELR